MNDIRRRRLEADYSLLRDLDQESDFIHVKPLGGNPPEAYRVVYSCKGVIGVDTTGYPQLGEHHVLEIELPAGYPAHLPSLRWRTPIHHPNIRFSDGSVCIDKWFAGVNLADIVVMIGDIVSYRNFNTSSPLDRAAALWADSHRNLFPVDSRPWRRGTRRLDDEIIIEASSVGSSITIELY